MTMMAELKTRVEFAPNTGFQPPVFDSADDTRTWAHNIYIIQSSIKGNLVGFFLISFLEAKPARKPENGVKLWDHVTTRAAAKANALNNRQTALLEAHVLEKEKVTFFIAGVIADRPGIHIIDRKLDFA